jgi:hypothetical protein
MGVGRGAREAPDMPNPSSAPRLGAGTYENRVVEPLIASGIARHDSQALTIAGLRWRFLLAVMLAGAAMLGVLAVLATLS